jgi:hypothetical protein
MCCACRENETKGSTCLVLYIPQSFGIGTSERAEKRCELQSSCGVFDNGASLERRGKGIQCLLRVRTGVGGGSRSGFVHSGRGVAARLEQSSRAEGWRLLRTPQRTGAVPAHRRTVCYRRMHGTKPNPPARGPHLMDPDPRAAASHSVEPWVRPVGTGGIGPPSPFGRELHAQIPASGQRRRAQMDVSPRSLPGRAGVPNWLSLRACDWCELDREPQRARRP